MRVPNIPVPFEAGIVSDPFFIIYIKLPDIDPFEDLGTVGFKWSFSFVIALDDPCL
jgi:hypothetical protein